MKAVNFITVFKWLKENDIEIYSTLNEEKYVVSEGLIRTFKNKIDKHMTLISKILILIN